MMTWREDRDALIAQTMAFVQSVTGTPADLAQFGPASPTSANKLPEAPLAASLANKPAAVSEQPTAREAAVVITPVRATVPAMGPKAHPSDAKPSLDRPPAKAAAQAIDVSAEARRPELFGAEPFISIAGQFTLQRDMQTEIRSRVASFRAHQERFNRERQEYFSATLARLHASKAATQLPDRSPPDK